MRFQETRTDTSDFFFLILLLCDRYDIFYDSITTWICCSAPEPEMNMLLFTGTGNVWNTVQYFCYGLIPIRVLDCFYICTGTCSIALWYHERGFRHWLVYYSDVIIDAKASLCTSLTSVYSTVHSCADQRKHQSSASMAFVRGIHRRPVNSPHKWPVTRKMFPFDDVIMDIPLGIVEYYMSPWRTILRLLSWYLIYKSSHCKSVEDRTAVDLSTVIPSWIYLL